MAKSYIIAPAADFTDDALTTLSNATLDADGNLTGLTNGVSYRAIVSGTAFTSPSFTPGDFVLPTLSSSDPADDSTDHPVGDPITITFSENIALGTGNIVLRIDTGGGFTDGETFDVAVDVGASDGQVSVSGATLTINPTGDLTALTDYAVRIAATAIEDVAGNAFAGISDDTTLNFTTAVVGTTYFIPIEGQSELARLFLPAHATLTGVPAVTDPSALTIYWYDTIGGGTNTDTITDANPVSKWMVYLSNALATLAPGSEFHIAWMCLSGTGLDDLLDDANGNRDWADDEAVYDAARTGAGGIAPSMAIIQHQNTPSALIQGRTGDAHWTALTGTSIEDGSTVTRGTQRYNVDYDNFFTDLTGWDANTIVSLVMHRYDAQNSLVVDGPTDVDTTTDEITVTGHPFTTGDDTRLSGSGIPEDSGGVLDATRQYYVIVVDANTIQLADSNSDAIAGTEIDLVATNSGNLSLDTGVDYDRFHDVRADLDAIVRNPRNLARGEPIRRGVDPVAYKNPINDQAHAEKSDDGAKILAEMIGYNIAHELGLGTTIRPEASVTWNTTGITIDSTQGNLTTTRIARSESLPAGQPKVANLFFAPAETPDEFTEVPESALTIVSGNVQIAPGALLTAIGGTPASRSPAEFKAGDRLQIGPGGAGNENLDDFVDDSWKDYAGVADTNGIVDIIPLQPIDVISVSNIAAVSPPTNLISSAARDLSGYGDDQGNNYYVITTNQEIADSSGGTLTVTDFVTGDTTGTLVVDLDRVQGNFEGAYNRASIRANSVGGAGTQVLTVTDIRLRQLSFSTSGSATPPTVFGSMLLPGGAHRVWMHIDYNDDTDTRLEITLMGLTSQGAYAGAGVFHGALTEEQVAEIAASNLRT